MDWPHLELVGEQHPLTLLKKSTESDNHLMLIIRFTYSYHALLTNLLSEK